MKRTATIGIKDLSSAVKNAVTAVAAREKVQLEQQLHIGPIRAFVLLHGRGFVVF